MRGEGEARAAASAYLHGLRVPIAIVAAACALLCGAAAAQASLEPVLRGSVANAKALSGATAVAVAGGYAYVTGYYSGELVVADLSHPRPHIVGRTPVARSLVDATNVAVSGTLAYVVSKNRNTDEASGGNDDGTGNSLTIVDVSQPTAPRIVGTLHDPVDLFGAYGIAVDGDYAYVASQGCLHGQPCPNAKVGDSFTVVDVSDPSDPRVVATLQNSNLPLPWRGSGALKHATSVALSGGFAYVTAAYTNRLTVIDVSDPLHPAIVASLEDDEQLAFPVDVAVEDGYAYVADQYSGLGRVAVVDVHDPTAPQVVASVTDPTWLDGAYRIRAQGDFVFVSAAYAEAVAVIDVSDPTSPRIAGGVQSPELLNHTTGIDVGPAARSVIASSPLLSTETQTNYPPFPLQAGGPTATGTVSSIVLDPAPLRVRIPSTERPTRSVTTPDATFGFVTTDDIAALRCSLDAAPLAPCDSPTSQSYSGLSPGSHTFTVEATDPAGDIASASWSWVVRAPRPGAPGWADLVRRLAGEL